MSHEEYVNTIKRELIRINKIIDDKIMNGENYFKEAKDHKLLLKKMRQHNQKSLFKRLLPYLFQI